MSDPATSSSTQADNGGPSPDQPRSRFAGRLPIVLLLIVSMTATVLTRRWAMDEHNQLTEQYTSVRRAGGGANLNDFDSFSLGLVLGGLRGPLVMYLWVSSEQQKIDRDLEGFRTKVELIRMLQPEFDSVHLFQIWNKAYNISAMRATTSAKYVEILDGLDYARQVLASRPDNINIVSSIADLYYQKFGRSAEKMEYIPWVRTQTLGKDSSQSRARAGTSSVHEVLLDPQGHILPQHLQPTLTASLSPDPDGGEPYNGADLQYLKPFDERGGFPYGLSPLALGYNYLKRAQALQIQLHQKHLQLTPMVIDSQPGLALKDWADDELRQARKAELDVLGFQQPLPSDPQQWGMVAATQSAHVTTIANTPANAAHVKEALFSLRRTQDLCEAASREFNRHLRYFKINQANYQKHDAMLAVVAKLARADEEYLAGLAMASKLDGWQPAYPTPEAYFASLFSPGAAQTADSIRAAAKRDYAEAAVLAYRTIFKEFSDDMIMGMTLYGSRSMAEQYTRRTIDKLDPKLGVGDKRYPSAAFRQLYLQLQIVAVREYLEGQAHLDQKLESQAIKDKKPVPRKSLRPTDLVLLARLHRTGTISARRLSHLPDYKRGQYDSQWELRRDIDRLLDRAETRWRQLPG